MLGAHVLSDETIGRVLGDATGDLLVGPFAGLVTAIAYFQLSGGRGRAGEGASMKRRRKYPASAVRPARGAPGHVPDLGRRNDPDHPAQLFLTNYPSLGGGKLHIAHLLWGGLLMMIALGMLFTLVGRRWRQPAAVIGGAGFGFFIDEVGKFVTSDNDYFFKPSAAIIYIVFICLYFLARWTRERRGFSDEEYVAGALDVFTDASVRDFNEREKRQALELLEQAGDHPLVGPLRELIGARPAGPELPPSRFARFAAAARQRYERWCGKRWFRRVVVGVMASLRVAPGARRPARHRRRGAVPRGRGRHDPTGRHGGPVRRDHLPVRRRARS